MRDALEGWDGQADSALDLRTRFKASPLAEGRVAVGDRGLSKIRRAYASDADPATLIRWLAKNPEELVPVAPLLGDPALGTWPWTDPFTLDDALATATLEVLGRVPVLADPDLRRFLRVLLRVRPRPIWTAAARAMACQAANDAELDATVRAIWAEAFPVTIDLGGGQTRLRRHALFLGACQIARGGGLPGPDPRELATRALPKDDADRSVVLQSLVALREDPAVASGLRALLADRKHGPLSERVVVQSLDQLDEATRDAVRTSLSRSRWSTVDGLLAWMDTARAFGLTGVDAGGATRALALAVDPQGTPLELVALLREALDPVTARLLPSRRRACAIAEAVALLEAPEVKDVPWPDIARAAGAFVVEVPGSASEVGPRAIGITTALQGSPVEHLLRVGDLGVEGMLSIAGLENAFVSIQVAVQMEAALRRAADDGERLRLLWRLLQRDPPSRTFLELDDMLRADARPGASASSPLIEIARAVAELYRHRADVPARELAEAMRALATVLDGLDVPSRPPLRPLAELVEAPGAEVVERLASLLGDGPGSLLRWTAWVDGTPEDALSLRLVAIEAALVDLRAAQSDLDAVRPLIDPSHVAAVRRACDRVLACITTCGWPERHAVAFVLSHLTRRADGDLQAGHRARSAARALDDAIRLGNESAIRASTADREALAVYTTRDLQRIHTFFLDQMAWWEAERFRRAARDRVALPSVSSHFFPMATAIAFGALLVQDFGTAWVEKADALDGEMLEEPVHIDSTTQASDMQGHVATVFLAVVLSWVTLTGMLARRFHSGDADRWVTVVARSSPIFIGAAAVAMASDAVVLLTLNQLEPATFVVGGALSLFLGVFVGLVLPSQGTPRD